jgi:hypothetical protein
MNDTETVDSTSAALTAYLGDRAVLAERHSAVDPETGLFVAANPDEASFRTLLHAHRRSQSAINLFDDRKHCLADVVDWMFPDKKDSNWEMAFRFVCLCVHFRIFSIAEGTWDPAKRPPYAPVEGDSLDRWIMRRFQAGEFCWFRCNMPMS